MGKLKLVKKTTNSTKTNPLNSLKLYMPKGVFNTKKRYLTTSHLPLLKF